MQQWNQLEMAISAKKPPKITRNLQLCAIGTKTLGRTGNP